MDDLKALQLIATALDAKKASDIVILDLREQSSYLSYFLIATSLSRAHLRTLFDETHKVAVDNGIERPRSQAPQYESGWVTYDFGFFVIHLFEAEKRKFYNLEGIWKNAKQLPAFEKMPKISSTNLNPRKGDSESEKAPQNATPKKVKKTAAKPASFAKKKTTIKKKTIKEKTMATAKKKPAKKKAAKKPAKKKAAKKK